MSYKWSHSAQTPCATKQSPEDLSHAYHAWCSLSSSCLWVKHKPNFVLNNETLDIISGKECLWLNFHLSHFSSLVQWLRIHSRQQPKAGGNDFALWSLGFQFMVMWFCVWWGRLMMRKMYGSSSHDGQEAERRWAHFGDLLPSGGPISWLIMPSCYELINGLVHRLDPSP